MAPALCVHAHFYHPLRGHPLTGEIGLEHSAAPFRNWNERILEQVYRPNCELDNFQTLSVDIESAFLQWLHQYRPESFHSVVSCVESYTQHHQVSNLIATPYYQSPLPLLSAQDRLTQLVWGRQVAKQAFGTEPAGVFLPGFAVDHATLQSVLDAGFQFTILRRSQVEGLPKRGGAGPYAIRLPSGDRIAVFVINEEISESMVEDMLERGGAGHWARRELGPYLRHCGPLTLLYIDGDMLGTHKMGEPYFVNYLLNNEIQSLGYQPVTLSAYYKAHSTPMAEILLLPTETDESALQHGLRVALHQLMGESAALTEDVAGKTLMSLRNRALDSNPQQPQLTHADMLLQRAWAQSNDVQRYFELSPSHMFQSVALALQLLHEVTRTNLTETFTSRLSPELKAEYERAAQGFGSGTMGAQAALASTNT